MGTYFMSLNKWEDSGTFQYWGNIQYFLPVNFKQNHIAGLLKVLQNIVWKSWKNNSDLYLEIIKMYQYLRNSWKIKISSIWAIPEV